MGMAKNEHQGLARKKRLKCPKCNNYTLWNKRDGCQCENGCTFSWLQGDIVLDHNDFHGYYKTQDLRDIFQYDDSVFPDITWKKGNESLYTKKQLERLNELQHRELIISNALDDVCISHSELYPEQNSQEWEMTHFKCLVMLTEDIYVYLNRMTKDLALMDIACQMSELKIAKGMMFPLTYFYFNLSQHLYETLERTMTWMGLCYGIPFMSDRKANTFIKIYKELKKNEEYLKSGLKPLVDTVMCSDAKNKLMEWRGSSTHDVSIHVKEMANKQIDPDEDRIKNDMLLIKDYIPGIITLTESLHTLYEKMVCRLDLFFDASLDTNAVNIIFETGKLEELKFPMEKPANLIIEKEYSKLSKRMNWLVNLKRTDMRREQMRRLGDVLFRLEESMKSCRYAIYYETIDLRSLWENCDTDQLFDIMDRQYLVYSATSLAIACYDKLARFLSEEYNLNSGNKNIYFDDFLKNNTKIAPPLKLAEKIIENEDKAYHFIAEYRNEYTHILRKGAIYLNAMDQYEDHLLYVTVYNIQYIGKLLDCIMKPYIEKLPNLESEFI